MCRNIIRSNKITNKASKAIAVAFCDDARAQTPPWPVAFTHFCIGYSTPPDAEIVYLAIAACVAALIGVVLVKQFRKSAVNSTGTIWGLAAAKERKETVRYPILYILRSEKFLYQGYGGLYDNDGNIHHRHHPEVHAAADSHGFDAAGVATDVAPADVALAPPGFTISGTGTTLEIVNGTFMISDTGEMQNGKPEYNKVGDADVWCYFARDGKWWVTDTEHKDANKAGGWAYAKSGDTATTDTAFIAAFSFRLFDLFTDVGVFQFTTKRVDFLGWIFSLSWAFGQRLSSTCLWSPPSSGSFSSFRKRLSLDKSSVWTKSWAQAGISLLCTNQVARLPSASWGRRSSWKASRN